jgi:hypothetical protein
MQWFDLLYFRFGFFFSLCVSAIFDLWGENFSFQKNIFASLNEPRFEFNINFFGHKTIKNIKVMFIQEKIRSSILNIYLFLRMNFKTSKSYLINLNFLCRIDFEMVKEKENCSVFFMSK